MANWINSWKSNNKKSKYTLTLRLGKVTLFELDIFFCNKKECRKFRLMLLNFGFEL